MTRKAGGKADTDPVLRALIEAQTPVVCIVGKSWTLHVTEVLGTTLEENLAMIGDSVALLKKQGKEVVYDAEHFFDGFRADRAYALAASRPRPTRAPTGSACATPTAARCRARSATWSRR